jgi:2-iminobutanoate/2-iminopropanoate deaminase
MSHHRETVTAVGAPAAVGPYSHAVKSNGLLFCSGQVALDAESGELVGETTAEQARKCLENLQAVAAAGGATLDDAVRCTIYILDMGEFGAVNAAYEEFFPQDPPARVTVAVSGLPKNGRVEIDAVIALPD